MRPRTIANAAFTGAATVAAVGFAAQPVNATPASTWHIKPGNGTAFTMANLNNPVLVDNATGYALTCTKASATGHLSGDGKATASAALATISALSVGTTSDPCSLAGIGFVWNLQKARFWGSQYANGVTTGHLGDGTASAISGSLNGVGSVACHVEVRGTRLPATYVNAGHSLNIDPSHATTLHVTSVQSCLGLYETGDSMYMSGRFAVNPPATITFST